MTTDLVLKVCDFGFSFLLPEGTVVADGHSGTPMYTAPEILKKEKYGANVDLWSVGVVMYQCLTGQIPYIVCFFGWLHLREYLINFICNL